MAAVADGDRGAKGGMQYLLHELADLSGAQSAVRVRIQLLKVLQQCSVTAQLFREVLNKD